MKKDLSIILETLKKFKVVLFILFDKHSFIVNYFGLVRNKKINDMYVFTDFV